MSRSTLLAAAVLVAALAFAAMPAFTSFSGFDPNAYPVPQEEPPAQPAGYAFSIWGVIYLWLIVSAGFGFWRRREDDDWARVRPPLLASLTIGVIWLPVAEASPVWALVLIWAMLAGALVAVLRTPVRDLWLLRAPLGLYAGWLTAASWVSVALCGAGYDVLPLSQTGWAVLAILGALATAIWAIFTTAPMIAFSLAMVWALVGILVANFPENAGTALLAGGGALVIAALSLSRRQPSGAGQ